MMRSDAKENLLTAIEIASAKENGRPIVPEVCIFSKTTCFGEIVRRRKMPNISMPSIHTIIRHLPKPVYISNISVHIFIIPEAETRLRVRTRIDQHVVILKLFPGITEQTVHAILHIDNLKAVVLESFGAGNAPRWTWLSDLLKEARAWHSDSK